MSGANVSRHDTEKQFSQTVVEYARLMGWTVFRTWSSIHSPYGEPDLRMVRPPRVVLAELKRDDGKVTPKQYEALELYRRCPGVETYPVAAVGLGRDRGGDAVTMPMPMRSEHIEDHGTVKLWGCPGCGFAFDAIHVVWSCFRFRG